MHASTPERRLGHYTLLRKLGQGGMGEVHLASDSRLERNVAIKLLPEDLRADPERRAAMGGAARGRVTRDYPEREYIAVQRRPPARHGIT